MQLLYVWFSHFWFIFHCWPSFSTLSVNVGLFALHCHSWWLGKIGINYNNTLSRWILFLTVNLVMLVSLNWIHILICRSNRPLLSDPPLLFTRIFSFWLRVGRKLLRHPSTPSPHPSYLASRWILSNSRDLGKMEKKLAKCLRYYSQLHCVDVCHMYNISRCFILSLSFYVVYDVIFGLRPVAFSQNCAAPSQGLSLTGSSVKK